jgi:hypothetical protein
VYGLLAELEEAQVSQALYILAFRDEPLIKIGVARNVLRRIEQLKADFNLEESYLITSPKKGCTRLLERNLHAAFSSYATPAVNRLTSGNTETFRSSILPLALDFVRAIRKMLSRSDFCITKGVPASSRRRQKVPRPQAVKLCDWIKTAFADLTKNRPLRAPVTDRPVLAVRDRPYYTRRSLADILGCCVGSVRSKLLARLKFELAALGQNRRRRKPVTDRSALTWRERHAQQPLDDLDYAPWAAKLLSHGHADVTPAKRQLAS